MKDLFSYFAQRPRLSLIAALAWTVLIFIGCSLPGKDLPKIGLFDHFDKVVHFTFFFIFFIAWRLYFNKHQGSSSLIFIVAILYGFALEFYQLHFVAGRSFDMWDAVADIFGAALAFIVIKRSISQ